MWLEPLGALVKTGPAIQYFLLGAIIVVPIWLIGRFLGQRRG